MLTELLLALAGAGLAVGVLLMACGLRGSGPDTAAVFRRSVMTRLQGSARLQRDRGLRWLAAAVVGALVWLVTSWPVAGLATMTFGTALPWLFGGARLAKQRIERLEAVGEWIRRLADLMSSGQLGLVRAIRLSGPTAPPAIIHEIATLNQRLGRWDFEPALLAFADDINDQIGDSTVAGLIVAHRQGSAVSAVLRALAAHISQEVSARRKVEIDRARPRFTAHILIVVTLAMFAGATLLVGDSYMGAYASPTGQLVLTVVAGLIALALVWLRQLSLGKPPPRFLASASRKSRRPI